MATIYRVLFFIALLIVLTIGERVVAAELNEAQLRDQIATLEKETTPAGQMKLAAIYESLATLLETRSEEIEAEKVLLRAIAIHQQLAAAQPKEAGHRNRLVDAMNKLSMDQITMQQWKEASATCKRAYEIVAQAMTDFPTDPSHRVDLARCHAHQSGMLWNMFRRTEAVKVKLEECRTHEKLVQDFPQDPTYRVHLLRSHRELGLWLISTGDHPQAEALLKKAVTVSEGLVQADAKNQDYQIAFEMSLEVLSYCFREEGKWMEAEKALRRVEVDRRANKANRPADEAQAVIAGMLRSLALVHELTRKPWSLYDCFAEATEIEKKLAANPNPLPQREKTAFLQKYISQESLTRISGIVPPQAKINQTSKELLEECQKLATKYPDVPGYQYRWAMAEIYQGNTVIGTGGITEAIERAETMMKITQKLVADFPDVPFYRLQIALGKLSQAATLFPRGLVKEGKALMAEAFAIMEKMGEENGGDAYYLYQICEIQLGAAPQGDPDGWLAAQLAAVATKIKLVEKFPNTTQYRSHLGAGYQKIARTLQSMNRHEQAEGPFRESVKHWGKLATDNPDVPDFRWMWLDSQIALAGYLSGNGKQTEATAQIETVLAELSKLVEKWPDADQFRLSLAGTKVVRGSIAERADDFTTAADFYGKSFVDFEVLLKANPHNDSVRQHYVEAIKARGLAFNSLRKFEEYTLDWDRARAVREEGERLREEARLKNK